ncbi:MAG TPA: SDR family oxidoreductase [Nitrospiria bacterium]|nr:SDR family oxidoreductase [Nitrospiria bacterium]
MELAGRIALVTGGAKRVGRSVALALARRGAHVAFTYQTSRQEAKALVRELTALGGKSLAVKADLRRAADAKGAVRAVVKNYGRIDVLVNNAAIYPRTPWASLDEKAWDEILTTNLRGPFLFAKAAGDRMLKQGCGKIVNLADWAGERPYKDYLPYCISKAGVIAMTKALALELAPTVQVNAVAPGPVLLPKDITAAGRRVVIAATPLRRIGSPDDIANAVVFLLEGSDFITGVLLPVDGGRLIA